MQMCLFSSLRGVRRKLQRCTDATEARAKCLSHHQRPPRSQRRFLCQGLPSPTNTPTLGYPLFSVVNRSGLTPYDKAHP